MEANILVLNIKVDQYHFEVRWTADLGRKKSEIHYELRELLETIYGIEDVEVYRYSAALYPAHHIIDMREGTAPVVAEIIEALRDENLAYVLKQHGFTNVQVVVAE